MSKNTWTPDRIEFLKKYWGTMTAREIASHLGGGVTRMAVLGKADRLNLPPSPYGKNPGQVRRPRKVTVIDVVQFLVPIITPETAVPLAECTGCRFPYGDGRSESYTFCNEKIYAKWMCRRHYEISRQVKDYTPPKEMTNEQPVYDPMRDLGEVVK